MWEMGGFVVWVLAVGCPVVGFLFCLLCSDSVRFAWSSAVSPFYMDVLFWAFCVGQWVMSSSAWRVVVVYSFGNSFQNVHAWKFTYIKNTYINVHIERNTYISYKDTHT